MSGAGGVILQPSIALFAILCLRIVRVIGIVFSAYFFVKPLLVQQQPEPLLTYEGPLARPIPPPLPVIARCAAGVHLNLV